MFAQPAWPQVRPPPCKAGHPNVVQHVSYPYPTRDAPDPTRGHCEAGSASPASRHWPARSAHGSLDAW
ncbi:hypothetical protein RSPO_m01686 (plasmid) [Ralstonia solanacearum Po82]|uniref:Uncharacterized protein n=1 Tax=Ralstonia solanacearum (strain Po82) TaxID=1031711 RepID=F6GBW3_RALS8|nr:hypothetical protein RSPO_m01686 [Ralstonia solanacearum Po82]